MFKLMSVNIWKISFSLLLQNSYLKIKGGLMGYLLHVQVTTNDLKCFQVHVLGKHI